MPGRQRFASRIESFHGSFDEETPESGARGLPRRFPLQPAGPEFLRELVFLLPK